MWSAPCRSLPLLQRWATLSRSVRQRIVVGRDLLLLLLIALLLPQSGLPYIEVLCKNRYVGRTFIQPNTRLRQLGVAKKFGALSDNFAGKRVVLIDDSIVRGNTISPIIKLLKEAGATEVCRSDR